MARRNAERAGDGRLAGSANEQRCDAGWKDRDRDRRRAAILRRYGGEYLAVSKTLRQFEGDGAAPDQVAIFTFPSLAAMNEFIECEDYAPYKKARLEQSSAQIVGFET